MKKSKKTFLIHTLFIAVLCLVFNCSFASYAQEDSPGDISKDEHDMERQLQNDDEADEPEAVSEEDESDSAIAERKESVDPAYEVLGRKLTSAEKSIYSDATKEDIKNGLLHKEQRLVIVRALVAIGEGDDARNVLRLMTISELKTFRELVKYFKDLKESSGSVVVALLEQSNKDPETAFRNAASFAYEEVYGVGKEQQDIQSIINYFKSQEVSKYSEMVRVLVDSMTLEDRKKLLTKALNAVGRADLIDNEKFVKKIIEQKFTYEKLLKLLKQIPGQGSKKKAG